MKFIRSAKLSTKLPAIITAIVIVAILVTSYIAHFSAKRTIIDSAEARMNTVATMRASAIRDYFAAIQRDLDIVAANPRTAEALAEFTTQFGSLVSPQTTLQRTYITRNPNPVGQLDLLVSAGTGDPYDEAHARYHPFFDHLQNVQGYYDVFLFDTDGNLVYSVFKELDYATNMMTGEWRDTDLAEAFRLGLEVAEGAAPAFLDFAPYAPSADAPASFMARAVFDASGERIGVLAYQMPIDAINTVVSNPAGLGETGDAFLVGRDGYLRTDSLRTQDIDILVTQVGSDIAEEAFFGERVYGIGVDFSGVEGLLAAVPVEILGVGWVLTAVESTNEVMAPLRTMELAFVIATVVLSLAALAVCIPVSRSITVPLTKVRDAMVEVSDKAYDTEVPSLGRADEIGDVSRALETFRTSLQEAEINEQGVVARRKAREASQRVIVDSLQDALSQLSDGNLAIQIDQEFEGSYDRIRKDFNAATGVLSAAMRTIVTNTGAIYGNATEIASAADDLAGRTESQAAALEQTAAALEELTASVHSASEGAQEVANLVGDAQKNAEQGEKIVEQAVNAMDEIETSSNEIANIISVIEDIAFQTNLLALNAGVEAARAGGAGKGFAVVATEVRALAQKSSEAAKEIKLLINASGEHVRCGVDRVNETGSALEVILDAVKTIAGHVRTIASTSAEQSTGLTEINGAMTHLDQVTQSNAAMVEETTAASHVLREEANELSTTTSRFRLQDGDRSPGQSGSNSKRHVA